MSHSCFREEDQSEESKSDSSSKEKVNKSEESNSESVDSKEELQKSSVDSSSLEAVPENLTRTADTGNKRKIDQNSTPAASGSDMEIDSSKSK